MGSAPQLPFDRRPTVDNLHASVLPTGRQREGDTIDADLLGEAQPGNVLRHAEDGDQTRRGRGRLPSPSRGTGRSARGRRPSPIGRREGSSRRRRRSPGARRRESRRRRLWAGAASAPAWAIGSSSRSSRIRRHIRAPFRPDARIASIRSRPSLWRVLNTVPWFSISNRFQPLPTPNRNRPLQYAIQPGHQLGGDGWHRAAGSGRRRYRSSGFLVTAAAVLSATNGS